jgi:hypothetical protein
LIIGLVNISRRPDTKTNTVSCTGKEKFKSLKIQAARAPRANHIVVKLRVKPSTTASKTATISHI